MQNTAAKSKRFKRARIATTAYLSPLFLYLLLAAHALR